MSKAKQVVFFVSGCLASAASFATSLVDYSSVSTTLTTELTSAVTAGLPIAGTVLGVGIGYRMYKKFSRG